LKIYNLVGTEEIPVELILTQSAGNKEKLMPATLELIICKCSYSFPMMDAARSSKMLVHFYQIHDTVSQKTMSLIFVTMRITDLINNK
jgi:hypothetical protein